LPGLANELSDEICAGFATVTYVRAHLIDKGLVMYDMVVTSSASPEELKSAVQLAMRRKSAGILAFAVMSNPYEPISSSGLNLVFQKVAGKEKGTLMEIDVTEAVGESTAVFCLQKYRSTRASVLIPGVVVSKDDLRNYARITARVLRKAGYSASVRKSR
jgi:hypothetical protein